MLGPQLERPVLSQAIRLSGAGLAHSLSAVTNVLFTLLTQKKLQLLLDGQDDEQIYIIFFLIYKSNKKEKLKSWSFTK